MSEYMVDDLTIVKSGGYDTWKEPLATADVAVKGKIEYKNRMVKSLAGVDIVSFASVLLPASIDVALGRELSHEDGLKIGGVKYAVVSIEKPKAFSCVFVFKYKVYVAWTSPPIL